MLRPLTIEEARNNVGMNKYCDICISSHHHHHHHRKLTKAPLNRCSAALSIQHTMNKNKIGLDKMELDEKKVNATDDNQLCL